MIKKLYYILFFVFQIYFVFTNNLFADNLLSKIQNSWDNIDSFQANFRQSSTSSLGHTIQATGSVRLKKPNLIRWEYLKPEAQLIIVGKQKVWIYDPLLDSISIEKKEKIASVDVFKYLFQKGGLQSYFKPLAVSKYANLLIQNKRQEKIYLEPKGEKLNIQELHLLVDKQKYWIQGILILDKDKQVNKFYLKNFKPNVEFSDKLFYFIPNSGTETIQ